MFVRQYGLAFGLLTHGKKEKRGLNDMNQPVARLKWALTLLDDTEIAPQTSIHT